jgi:nondiscriminating glutamyl-tRNA synthetase
MTSQIRVRFAPSPTGSLHLGGVRTALYNYLLAKKENGQFIIRVEDTDLERNQLEASDKQLADLKWLGLEWDQGPQKGGDCGPYLQSQRTELYQEQAELLIKAGKAFYCFLTDEEQSKLITHVNRQLKSPYRDMDVQEALVRVKKGEDYAIRFKNDHTEIFSFKDLIHGETELKGDMVGDFVLIRSNKLPVYNFCCAIDDHFMKITHVLRGEEHLSNTLRQLMLYDVFGWERPLFGHLSMILGANRKKLSKRDDAVSVKDFISGGYLPEAILNYVALLGWSAKSAKEKLDLSELIELFSLDRAHKSPAMFDRDKLNWLNHYYLQKCTPEEIILALGVMGKSVDKTWFVKFWMNLSHHFNTLVEVIDALVLFESYKLVDKELIIGEGRSVIEAFVRALNDVDHMDEAVFSNITKTLMETMGVKGKRLFAPIRVGLIGVQSGIELKALAKLLSKEEMLKRLSQALS